MPVLASSSPAAASAASRNNSLHPAFWSIPSPTRGRPKSCRRGLPRTVPGRLRQAWRQSRTIPPPSGLGSDSVSSGSPARAWGKAPRPPRPSTRSRSSSFTSCYRSLDARGAVRAVAHGMGQERAFGRRPATRRACSPPRSSRNTSPGSKCSSVGRHPPVGNCSEQPKRMRRASASIRARVSPA